MRLSRSQVEAILARRTGIEPNPKKNRARVGTGNLARKKQWLAEMARLPGVFIEIRLYSEANMRDKWGTIERTKKHREAVALCAKAYIQQFIGKKPLAVKLVRYGPRPFDSDNLARSFKAPQDEIAHILGVNDGDDSAIKFTYHQEKTRVRCYGLRIEVFEGILPPEPHREEGELNNDKRRS